MNLGIETETDFDSEKTDVILGLKREGSLLNRKIRGQKAKLIPLQENLMGIRTISEEDIENIKNSFRKLIYVK